MRMQWLRTMAREVWGLFVDDGSFAGAILAWLVVAALVLPRTASRWAGPVWFAGLAVILVESVARFSRRRK